jgi:dihydrofolate synthase / folylpolyglutamate synthase
MSSSEYQRALDFLFARTTGGVRLGLDRTFAILKALGDPHLAVPCFHVAGTNGKGSTVASIAAMLKHQGMRVATYTSPHLVDFRERIVVGGKPIGEDDVVRFIHDHVGLIEGLGATFFEATTAMAFDHIARAGADVSVIETGLGGRLDSTNVVDPLAAVVTSISMDHVDLLGDTLEKIALEKAGIFKRGRPAVIGMIEPIWPTVRATLEAAAQRAGSTPIARVYDEVDVHWQEFSPVWGKPDWTAFEAEVLGEVVESRTGLIGRFQVGNAMTAWMALHVAGRPYDLPLREIRPALEGLRLPGRFHRVGNLLFDVAHNPEGLGLLLSTFEQHNPPRPVRALVGILSDKDWRSMLQMLGTVDEIIATIPPTAPPERRWNLDEVTKFANEFRVDLRNAPAEHRRHFENVRINLRAIPDFDEALRVATSGAGATLITGSFHTVGDAMARLQVNPLAG